MKSAVDKFVINKIREKRIQEKVSQRGLAAILGCSDGFIGQVESDKYETKYSVYQIFLIAKEFECPVSDFFPSLNTDF